MTRTPKNTAAASGRIEINGQRRRLCDQGDMTVSRSMPAVLSDRVVYSSWIAFCDEIDEALSPASKAAVKMTMFAFLLIFLIVVAITFGMVFYDSSSTSAQIESFIPYFVAFLLVISGAIALWCWGRRVRGRLDDAVGKVCQETTSKMNAGIVFRARRDGSASYIEVRLSDRGYVAPTASAVDAAAADSGIGDADMTMMEGLLADDELREKTTV